MFIDPVSYVDGPTLVRLDCGHSRGEITPLQAGHVSLENLKTAAGIAAFPPMPDAWMPNWRRPE
jgi:hypothetical protein